MNQAQPKAFLIAHTSTNWVLLRRALQELGAPDWETDADNAAGAVTEFAGKLCYMSFDKSLNANLTRTGGRTNAEYIQDQIVGQKHGSVLEHTYATFLLTNVSRVVTHELVRHRAGTAFSQVSGRYVRGEPAFYIPRILRDNPRAILEFERAHDAARAAVLNMEQAVQIDSKSFSIKKALTSAIRRITGNGQANHIVMTANHRAWRHIIAMRTAEGAEEEIRDVVGQIARGLVEIAPAIYADMIETAASDFPDLPVYSFKHEKV